MFTLPESVVLAIVVSMAYVYGDTDCTGVQCPKVPKHYIELGCKAMYDDEQCCPLRYDCPDIEDYDKRVCHFRGKTYNVSEEIPTKETDGLCSAACYCDGGSSIDEVAELRCAQIECGHFFDNDLNECVHQSTLNSCCPNYICHEHEIKQLATCTFDGRSYKIGEIIYPESARCHKCICTVDFNNSTAVLNNPDCVEIDCGIELRYLDKIRAGCIPIYYGWDGCCPIDFKCPTDDDIIILSDSRAGGQLPADPSQKCKFGDSVMYVGDEILSDDPCDICTCEVPPYAHCVKQQNC